MSRKSKLKQTVKTDGEALSVSSSPVSTRLRSANKKSTHNDAPGPTPAMGSTEKGSQDSSLSTEKIISEETLNSESVTTPEIDVLTATVTKEVKDSETQEVNMEITEPEKTTGEVLRPESSDDEAAPEEVSMSMSKAQELDAQKRRRAINQRLIEEKKQKRRELDLKYKEQRNRKLENELKEGGARVNADQSDSTKRRELPTLLPKEILEDLAIEEKTIKKRKNVSTPNNITTKPPRKKKNNDTGPFTVVVIDRDQPRPVSKEIIEFRESHFYGDRLPRKNAILNASQKRNGAALRFRRR